MNAQALLTLQEPYSPRPIRFLELWKVGEWRIKVYGITYQALSPEQRLVHAAKTTCEPLLVKRSTQHATYGVGFLGIHQGRGANQVFLDRWINENELLHQVFISSTAQPEKLAEAPADFNSVCIWDLHVQCFERKAWIDCVLKNPAAPDLEAYLNSRMNADE